MFDESLAKYTFVFSSISLGRKGKVVGAGAMFDEFLANCVIVTFSSDLGQNRKVVGVGTMFDENLAKVYDFYFFVFDLRRKGKVVGEGKMFDEIVTHFCPCHVRQTSITSTTRFGLGGCRWIDDRKGKSWVYPCDGRWSWGQSSVVWGLNIRLKTVWNGLKADWKLIENGLKMDCKLTIRCSTKIWPHHVTRLIRSRGCCLIAIKQELQTWSDCYGSDCKRPVLAIEEELIVRRSGNPDYSDLQGSIIPPTAGPGNTTTLDSEEMIDRNTNQS